MCLETKDILSKELKGNLKFEGQNVIDLDSESEGDNNIQEQKLKINIVNAFGDFQRTRNVHTTE